MGSQEVLEATMAFHSTNGVNGLESKQAGIGIEQTEDLDIEFIKEYDKMMEDYDTQLMVARMVSDSVIKGAVSAVEQVADEKIKAKELELESLKSSSSLIKGYAGFEEVCVKHDEMKESVVDEFKRLRKQIEGVKGCKIRRNGSCHEMVGLGGILKDEFDLGKTVDNLEMMMNDMSKLVDTALICSKTSLSEWQHKHDISNISDLRNELESLIKLLPSHDPGHLISHGSLDIDMTHGNPLRSQLSSRLEENGESTESKPDVADSFDANTLSHMNKEQLVKFFNNRMLNLKRGHEAEVHMLTDNYIHLRRKYLNERQSFVPAIKDFELLKRKIPEVVAKLDDVLCGSDEFIGKGDKVVSFNAVLKENCQLRDSLAVMKDEVKNHESLMADAFLEASVVEDVYKCVIRELDYDIQNLKEESELKIVAMQDVYKVLLENTSIRATEDMRVEALFTQELLETVFKETLMDVNQRFEILHEKYITTNEKLVSLETKAMAMEAEMILEAEESENLRNQVNLLRNLMEEKEALARDEINNLRKRETLLLKANKELDEKLSKADEKNFSDKMEISSLNQRLALAMEEIQTSNEYKQRFTSLIEANEREHRKKMEAVVVLVDEITTKFDDFESRVTWDVKNNYTRLENSRIQLSSLVTAANVLKNTGIIYKQKLERKCCDLQMAEEEVDLLGDEVETLFGLLEKIYIALDHYSPVLRHYPGVIEILELVRRELSGESLKAH